MIYLKSLPTFEYFLPESLKEACSFLKEHGDRAKIVAGGTDLLIHMKYRKVAPRFLVSLRSLPELSRVTFSDEEGLRIGAMVTHQEVMDRSIINEKFKSVAFACSKVGTPQIRNMGTVGGNICNAAPSADSVPPLMTYNATVTITGPDGERAVPLEDVFVGPGQNCLKTGEILSEIRVPVVPPHTGAVYVRLSARTAKDIAAVGVAALITIDPVNGACSDAKIVLAAVAPVPLRASKAEAALKGEKLEEESINSAALLSAKEARPISDVRSSADYRTEMVRVLTRRALNEALAIARAS
jgi:aerobic carbon-monoxide dehydrogenase medium subunit